MARKKDFTEVNARSVYNRIDEATAAPDQQEEQQAQEVPQPRRPRKTYTEQEGQQFIAAGKTQGRKGLKAVRINMAFTPEVYDYIKTLSRVRGESIQKFTEYIFARSMDENREIYEQAKAFRDSI